MSKLWVDIETYSSVDLKKYGVYRYAASPDFLILMAAWSTDGETVQVALGQDDVLDIPGLFDPDVVKVAHNAQFERVCFSSVAGLPPGEYLPPEQYRDTQAVAGELGYPQSLDNLAKSIGAERKDPAGTRLINTFCKPNRKGVRTLPEDKPMEWLDFIAYCEQDVYTLIEVDRLLEEQGDWPTEAEAELFLSDQRINDTGLPIDVPMVRKAVHAATLNHHEQQERVCELTGVENANSVQQLMEWAENQGLGLPNLKAETVEARLLKNDLDAIQQEVLELRLELALAASAKFTTALNSVLPDGRLRGSFKFFGAHTGRWAGRGAQPQNLPRLAFDSEVDAELAISDLMAGERISATELKKLVRPMFLGPFTVVDYSAIEARVVSWLGGEEWALEAFRAGRDIYVETAERMGGLTRAQGKIAVLALGYNGGANSLRAMASPKDKLDGTRLIDLSDEEIYDRLVYPWRNANSAVVKLWARLERAFRAGGAAGPILRVEKVNDNRDRLLRLPSGRAIAYRKCGIQKRKKLNPRTGKLEEREVLTFWSPSGYRADTYGGRLTENATQAVARDIMAEAIVRLHRRGYSVVGHVHDEIIIEGEHDVETVSKIMCEPPAWSEGLPINGEGFTCARYRKG